MKGYWDDPEAIALTMRGGWLHTGDIGRVDERGLLCIVDRKTEMYISGGYNDYPAEVELGLCAIPSVTRGGVATPESLLSN